MYISSGDIINNYLQYNLKHMKQLERLNQIKDAITKCTDELMSLLSTGKCTIKDIERLNNKVIELQNEGILLISMLNQVQTAFN